VIIEANYFSNPYDMAVLVRAIKDSLLIGHSSHFKQFGAKFYDKPLDQCSQVLHISDITFWSNVPGTAYFISEQCSKVTHTTF
jgi:hypothetical protein